MIEDNLKWRFRSKIVAFMDLCLVILTLLGLFVLGMATLGLMMDTESHFETGQGFKLTSSEDNTDVDTFTNSAQLDDQVKYVVVFAVVLASLYAILQLSAVIKLVKATELGRGTKDALTMAKFYRNVTAVSVVLGLLSFIRHGDHYYGVGVILVLRAIFLYIVSNFVTELNSKVTLLVVIGITPSATTAAGGEGQNANANATNAGVNQPPPSYEDINIHDDKEDEIKNNPSKV